MNKIQNPELFMTTAGGRITCRRCVGYSRRTQKQCNHPALRSSSKSRCKWHSGASTGPQSKEGIEAIKKANTKHGKFTKEATERTSKQDAMFRYLADIGNYLNMFTYKVKTRGRASKHYHPLDLSDPEQLAQAIKETLVEDIK
ncbi:HGGxSTG domain-containing protein [Polynucleobacter sp. AP-Nickl1-40-C4]|uniref:HGGxSTG domain-containing protein n=1 Tax=Polynucleobacter sp. AP-Nickl1-40-C4 TaxID=3108275 RepID=UPI002B233813|nr:HGGxSTG domain-containing protein [Polynucleobacter sp. AP-Nickl1-40-C4]MEA9567535.1 HGGxSTG domain-containing protein [Polynucleobacter sp. AP-Nickl1-40-C4]